MKKVILAVVCLTAFTVLGQEQKKEYPSADRERERMTPEQMAILQTKKMTLTLDLSKEQQTKIEKLNLENAKNRQSKMEAFRAKKESGALKKLTSEERFAMANARLDEQIAQQEQMKKILNAEQFEKWTSLKQKERHHHRGGKFHRGDKREKGSKMEGKK
jgi:hypothetical protein